MVSRVGKVAGGVLVAVAAVLLLLFGLRGLLPSLPFGTETRDRSGPVLLTSLRDLARFQAASATLQQVVDLEDDVRLVPSVLAGQRTLFLAYGTVDASVEFGGLDGDAVTVSDDRRSARIVLPAAVLSEARVDLERSRLLSRDRGVLDRIGGIFSDAPTSEGPVLRAAQQQIGAAARDSDLQQRAEANTRAMLVGLLGTLGYTDVQVEFSPEVRP